MDKIIGIYKITNTVTNDCYIGSSKNVKQRWKEHKCQSKWNKCPNNPMYQDMRKYGVDKFVFEILAEVEIDSLKETEQQFIETLKPTYNSNRAKGLDVERRKESQKKYKKSDKGKESYRKASNKYYESKKEQIKQQKKQYYNQLCLFNGETLTLNALRTRFKRRGITHPTLEAKKYLIKN